MGFRDQDGDQTLFYELVRIRRATGHREILSDRDSMEGRWAADAALRRILEENRDPSVTYEVQPVATSKKRFRAAAFGDCTERLSAFKDPFEKS
jgi:hypothetical protein